MSSTVAERMLCALVQRYPFNTQAIFHLGDRKLQSSHPLIRFTEFLESYEREILFKKLDVTTIGLRSALGYQRRSSWMTSENIIQLQTTDNLLHVGEHTYEKLCCLLTAYRLIDLFACHPLAGEANCPPNQVRPKFLKDDMIKTKQWDKLRNWPKILRDAKVSVDKMKSLNKDENIKIVGNNHIRHLFAIAKRGEIGKFTHIVDNFQIAAMHLSYMLKMPAQDNNLILPDIPDDLKQLLNLQESLPIQNSNTFVLHDTSIGERESYINRFLEEMTASKLRFPLQLALIISPLFLLMTTPLINTKWKHSSLVSVSEALGNNKPKVLHDIESQILSCLFRIAENPEDLLSALYDLVGCKEWLELEQLPRSNPAFDFFHGVPSAMQPPQDNVAGPLSRSRGKTVPCTSSIPSMLGPTNLPYPNISSMSTSPIYHFTIPMGPVTTDYLPIIKAPPSNRGQLTVLEAFRSSHEDTEMERERGGSGSVGMDVDEPQARPDTEKERVADEGQTSANGSDMDIDGPRAIPDSRDEGQKVANRIDMGVERERLNLDVHMAGSSTIGIDVDEPQAIPDVEKDTVAEDDDQGYPDQDGDLGIEQSPQESVEKDQPPRGRVADKDEDTVLVKQPRKLSDIEKESEGESEVSEVDEPPPNLSIDAQRKQTRGSKRKRPKKPKQKKIVQEVHESEDEVIDVDLFEDKPITLDVKAQPPKLTGPEITAYGPKGETMQFKPQVYDNHTLEIIVGLWNGIEDAYEDGQPLHISNPSKSVFRILSHTDAEHMTDATIQDILRTQHIVLTDVGNRAKDVTFKQGLQALGAWTTVTTIQDLSIPVLKNYNKRKKQGEMRQLLEASELENGKILNALDIPMPMAGLQPSPYSSDLYALEGTLGQWKTRTHLSVGDFRWALAATAGAFHTWHIDSDGLLTFINTRAGAKWWIIARPRDDTNGFGQFANIDLFTDGRFDIDKTCRDLWILEAMLIEPGTVVIMRPNTPHAVFTPSHSIVHGGHMFARSTLQDTFAGIVHCLIASSWITNTNHNVARFHLQQMIAFYHLALVEKQLEEDDPKWDHIPNCSTNEGFHDLMALCLFGILINVLDFNTYIHPQQLGSALSKVQKNEMLDHDINNLGLEERRSCTYTRGQSLQIMDYVAKSYKMEFPDNEGQMLDSIEIYQHNMILKQCRTLYQYKLLADAKEIEGAPGCTLEMLSAQLLGALPLKHAVSLKIKETLRAAPSNANSMAISEHPRASFKKVETRGFTLRKPMALGINQRDELYQLSEDVKMVKMQDDIPRKRQKRE